MKKIILSALFLGLSPAMAFFKTSENLNVEQIEHALNDASIALQEQYQVASITYIADQWNNHVEDHLPLVLDSHFSKIINDYQTNKEDQEHPSITALKSFGLYGNGENITAHDFVNQMTDSMINQLQGQSNTLPENIDGIKTIIINNILENLEDPVDTNLFKKILTVEKPSIDSFQKMGCKAFDQLSVDDAKHMNEGLQLYSGHCLAETIYATESLDDIYNAISGLLTNKSPDLHFLGSIFHLLHETSKFYVNEGSTPVNPLLTSHFFNMFYDQTPKQFFEISSKIVVKEQVQSNFNDACTTFLNRKLDDFLKIAFSDQKSWDKSKKMNEWWSGKKA